MPAAARIGDSFSCGDIVKDGSPDVFCNGLPVGRLGDGTTGHNCGPPTTIEDGSGSVFANGMPLARAGDGLIPHGTCDDPPHNGNIVGGSPDVFSDG